MRKRNTCLDVAPVSARTRSQQRADGAAAVSLLSRVLEGREAAAADARWLIVTDKAHVI